MSDFKPNERCFELTDEVRRPRSLIEALSCTVLKLNALPCPLYVNELAYFLNRCSLGANYKQIDSSYQNNKFCFERDNHLQAFTANRVLCTYLGSGFGTIGRMLASYVRTKKS